MSTDRTYGVGVSIRECRKRLGMTQEELGKAVGLQRTSVVNIESGRQGLTVAMLIAAARALKIKPHELLGYSIDDVSACCGELFNCRVPCTPRADHWQRQAHEFTDRIHELQGHITKEALRRARDEEDASCGLLAAEPREEAGDGSCAARTMGTHSTEAQTADYVRQRGARKTSATR